MPRIRDPVLSVAPPTSPSMRFFVVLATAGLCFVTGWPREANGQDAHTTSQPADRPRVALVLSGGGARGLAHIGVLRALRELRVPVDIVVGTSMGSVIGGAYAAGRSVEELEAVARSIAWTDVLADRLPRDRLTQRRREEDLDVPSRLVFGLSRDGLTLPPAAAGNAALEVALARLLPPGLIDRPVNALALPFRAVATDLLTGERVELTDAPVLMALRASLSVPGVFTPVRLGERLLVDGGLVSNLPVDVARRLGAEVVIAVNLGTSLAPASELSSSVGVAQQMLNILTEQNVQRSLKELGPADVLITPELGDMGFLDFKRQEQALEQGAAAVFRLADRLRALAVSAERYAALESSRQDQPLAPGAVRTLAQVVVQGAQRINPDELQAQSGLLAGAPLTPDLLQGATARLYGRGDLARVETVISEAPEGQHVAIKVTEAAWAQNQVRLGLELNSDFADSSGFGVVGMHLMTSMNRWGAEWRTIVRVGSARSIATQWWQPLGVGSPWYVLPELQYGSGASDLWLDGRRQLRLGSRSTSLGLAMGRQFGQWGDVRLGVVREVGRSTVLIPQDPPLSGRFAGTSRFIAFNLDSLEPLSFPVNGQLIQARWSQAVRRDGGPPPPLRSQVVGLYAFSAGKLGGHLYGEWARQRNGFAPRSLGGFLRLSGAAPQSVEGSTVLLTRLVLAQQVGDLPLAAGGAIRAGLSVEFGNGFAPGAAVNPGSLRRAGSVFVSADTRFGPVYLAAGATRGTAGTLYLFLGPIW
jgi:NTE family protein